MLELLSNDIVLNSTIISVIVKLFFLINYFITLLAVVALRLFGPVEIHA